MVFYRHCGEGWGWSGENASDNANDIASDTVEVTDPHGDSHKVPLEEIIKSAIRADNKVTRAKMAELADVSPKTIARKLKEKSE